MAPRKTEKSRGNSSSSAAIQEFLVLPKDGEVEICYPDDRTNIGGILELFTRIIVSS